MKRFAVTMLAALGALLAAAPGSAGDVTCTTVNASFTTIDGNLVVPDNKNCRFLGGVTRNVTVGKGASLDVASPNTGDTSAIAGNVQASNCAYVEFNYGAVYKTLVGGVRRRDHREISSAITIPGRAFKLTPLSVAMCSSTIMCPPPRRLPRS